MEVQVITQEMLQTLSTRVGQTISGVTLCRDYSVQLTKNGKEYVVGEIMSGVAVSFKAWNNSGAFSVFKSANFRNTPVFISANVDNYGDSLSLVVNQVKTVEGFTVDMFMPNKYDVNAYWNALKSKAEQKVSEKGVAIIKKVLFDDEELVKRFMTEFAAMSHHDNCKGGLLAHTYKVFNLMGIVLQQYPSLVAVDGVVEQDFVDLLFIGALLHDIGKTVEMNLGVYQPESCVTHAYLGSEFISKYKDDIVAAYDSMWYYNLISIMLQHHGDFGMPCKTVWAYAVHLVDCFESDFTLLSQKLDESTDSNIKIDGKYLSY